MRILSLFSLFAGIAVAQQAAQKSRPVSKVISLLKDMQSALQKEGAEDEATYDKLACWCTTNDKEKTAAIAEAEKRITELVAFTEQAAALISQLESEITGLEKSIADNRASLEQAASIRAKEKEEYNGFAKETTAAIGALQAAITVLSKQNRPPAEALINIATILRHNMHTFEYATTRALSPKQRRALESFIQEPDFFGKRPSFKDAYGNQSGEIFGILSNMKENFEADLKDATAEEEQKQKAYDDLKAAKEAEVAAATENLATKKGQLADTRQKLADAEQDIADTRTSLSADQQYLMDLKVKCQMTDAEWAERQQTRAQEVEAVAKAVAILSGDDAHDLFTRTFNRPTSFIQSRVHHKTLSFKRRSVATLLKRASRKADAVHAASLIQLAASAQLDAFTSVIESVDKMVEALKKEQADEAAQKDWCNKELAENARQTDLKNRDKADAEIRIDSLNTQIASLTREVEVLSSEIAELQKQLELAGKDREAEHHDFMVTVADAEETQKLLQQAIDVLNAFYNKQAAKSFAQTSPAGPPPPAGFKTYANQSSSNGVITLLTTILTDAARLQSEATKAEEDAQRAYELFVKDSNASMEAKQRDTTNKLAEKALAESDLTAAKSNKGSISDELVALASFVQQVHTSCDFVLKNFELRQSARAQEVEALGQAKAILRGMKSE